MPFDPKNAPELNTVMMYFLRDDYYFLSKETKNVINLDTSPSTVICDNRIIIDDILLFSNRISTILHCLQNVAEPKVYSVLTSTSTYVNFNFSTKLPIASKTLHTYST